MPPEPEATFARHVHGHGMSRFGAWPKRVRSAGTGSPVRSCARATRATVGRSAVESDASTRLRAAILHREDGEDGKFLGRKPETGGYSYPSLGRVRALQAIPRPWIPPNGPQGAQNGRESGFPGFGGARGSDSCHQSAKEPPKGGSSSPRRSRPTLPASGSIEDHVGRVVGHNGATLAGGPRDGIRGVEHLDAVRSRGGPETPGSEGAQPPASPSGRHTECGHGG